MKECIVICDSGNYCMRLQSLLQKEGYYSEVTSTPCKLASGGCSYCVKISLSVYKILLEIARVNNINIKAAYEIEPQLLKNNYIPL